MSVIAPIINNRPTGKLDPQGHLSQDSFLDEAFLGDYLGGMNLIYKGFARPGTLATVAQWQIAFCTYDVNGNVTAIQWPQNSSGIASSDYLFEWNLRTTYVYS
jgi:hypothetical protein